MGKGKSVIAAYVRATNDRSGNPRRGWVIYDHINYHRDRTLRRAYAIDFIDEEYSGREALRETYPNAIEVGPLGITPVEYKSLSGFRGPGWG
jgi:hypothetical protein